MQCFMNTAKIGSFYIEVQLLCRGDWKKHAKYAEPKYGTEYA